MLDFVEPASNRPLISLAQAIWPVYAKARFGNLQIELSAEVLEAFKALGGQGTVICPNHCAHEDPDVIFGLSRIVGQRFYYLTAREIFGGKHTLRSRWLQKLGCFSVERGLPDIESFKAARDLLVNGEQVVIFPEGEITHQNDYLIKLEDGPERIALAALRELRESQSSQSVFILPLALKYRYPVSIMSELNKSIATVEKILGIEGHEGLTKARIRRSYDKLASWLEPNDDSVKLENESLDQKLWLLRQHLISQARHFLQAQLDQNSNQLQQIHILKSMFTTAKWSGETKENYSEARTHYRRLRLATSLIAIGQHSFDGQLTEEDAAELVMVLEESTLGKRLMQPPPLVTVGAGEIINVKSYEEAFHKNRKCTVEELKADLRKRIERRLQALEDLHPRRFVD